MVFIGLMLICQKDIKAQSWRIDIFFLFKAVSIRRDTIVISRFH